MGLRYLPSDDSGNCSAVSQSQRRMNAGSALASPRMVQRRCGGAVSPLIKGALLCSARSGIATRRALESFVTFSEAVRCGGIVWPLTISTHARSTPSGLATRAALESAADQGRLRSTTSGRRHRMVLVSPRSLPRPRGGSVSPQTKGMRLRWLHRTAWPVSKATADNTPFLWCGLIDEYSEHCLAS
jgi:hypothetical protein